MKNSTLKMLLPGILLACMQSAWADKYFYVMLPNTGNWVGATPMISMDGGKTGLPLTIDQDIPDWYSYKFTDEQITDNAVIFCEVAGNKEILGANGTGETSPTPEPIALESIYFGLEVDSVFFIPDVDQNVPQGKAGLYASLSEIGTGGNYGPTEEKEVMLAFVSAPEAGSSVVTGPSDDAEFFTKVRYKLYLAILQSDGKGGFELCTTCKERAYMGAQTYIGVSVDPSIFRNGYSTVVVSSEKEGEAFIEVCLAGGICSTYGPVMFKSNPDALASVPAVASRRMEAVRAGSSIAIVSERLRGEKYAVMDLQGRVIREGIVRSDRMVLPGLSAGSYVVKVSSFVSRVDIR